jgi:hypothetical protein
MEENIEFFLLLLSARIIKSDEKIVIFSTQMCRKNVM